ncbi:MAG: DUF393 domain-containing protein [Calditrichaeota bacterium]|nr:MAG: DUF393 domain-containing protein [Calditrichota bacterium]
MSSPQEKQDVIFFDDRCSFCRAVVGFVRRIDRRRKLAYAPLDGDLANSLVGRAPQLACRDSVVLIRNLGGPHERVTTRSTAVLLAFERIGGLWRAVSWLRVIPRPLRDGVYGQIARNRHRLFGATDTCPAPGPPDRS